MSSSDNQLNWLEKPNAATKIFWTLVVLAVLVAVPDILSLFHIVYEMHPYNAIEEMPVFYGLYGLIAFLTLIAIAKFIQPFLKRADNYYD